MRKIRYIVVHYSVTGTGATVDQIRRAHLDRGYSDIGYHRVILHPKSDQLRGCILSPVSLIKMGRPDNKVGAHASGFNTPSLGVCVVGHPDYPPDPMQLEALKITLDTLVSRFNGASVKTHRELNPTACPGRHIQEWVNRYRGEAENKNEIPK